MFHKRTGATRRVARLAAAVLLLLDARAAPTQEPPQSADSSGVVDRMQSKVRISLAAQPLGESLRSLAKQADLQILFDAALVAGRPARALSGVRSARQALSDLLRGTGLVALEQAPGVVVIRAAAVNQQTPSGAESSE